MTAKEIQNHCQRTKSAEGITIQRPLRRWEYILSRSTNVFEALARPKIVNTEKEIHKHMVYKMKLKSEDSRLGKGEVKDNLHTVLILAVE